MSFIPIDPELIKILHNLSKMGKVQSVPFDVRLKVAYRLPHLITTPNGWAVSNKTWTLTDIGRRAMGYTQ